MQAEVVENFFKYKRTLACPSLTSRVSVTCFRYSLRRGEMILAYEAPRRPVLYSSSHFAEAGISIEHSKAGEQPRSNYPEPMFHQSFTCMQ